MARINKSSLVKGLVFGLFFVFSFALFVPSSFPCGGYEGKGTSAKKKVVPQSASFMSPAYIMSADEEELVEQTVKVEGMDCEKCSKAIEREVKKINGVIEVHADHKAGTCHVKFKKDKVKIEDIYKAIEKAGFKPVAG